MSLKLYFPYFNRILFIRKIFKKRFVVDELSWRHFVPRTLLRLPLLHLLLQNFLVPHVHFLDVVKLVLLMLLVRLQVLLPHRRLFFIQLLLFF